MRSTVFLTALLATLSAISAFPVPSTEQVQQQDTQPLARSKNVMTSPKVTYYSGKQMDNPACGGATPTSKSMIAAVKQGGAFSCGDEIHVQHNGNSVKVKVVDYCAGCSSKALDLSPGAFSKLAPLSQGEITNAKVWLA